jgi:hypothetical protein
MGYSRSRSLRHLRTLTCLLGLAVAVWFRPASAEDVAHFPLVPNPPFLNCLAADAAHPPVAEVTVVKGKLNDILTLHLRGVKPGLAFDLFTVQRSPFLADGSPDPDFAAKFNRSFGLAWYQSDIEANEEGRASVRIRTILLNQIFGFDPDVQLTPTNTFHVGFWFNDPNDAAACGFTGFTPFNGEHHAGPLAMISLPNPDTGLGPLCLTPNTETDPISCNP